LNEVLQLDVNSNNRDWAVITPSYRGDFERCRLLCQSMDAFVTGSWHHYIIVETVDLELFKPLSGPRRTVLEMEALLPASFHHLTRIPFINNRSLWFSWGTRFMAGWHVQQLIKIEMAFQLGEQGLLYCDSDVFFVRPFDISSLCKDGRYRYFSTADRYEEKTIPNPKYTTVSARLLGIKENPFPSPTYVDNLVVWHSPTVRTMCAHISQVSGRDWRVSLGREIFLSEYSIYGLYVDHVLKNHSHLRLEHNTLCKTVWHRGVMDDAALASFCSELGVSIVALGVQSFAGVAVERLEKQLHRAVQREGRRV
jgi:Family of unknown function (DUF6492)